MTDQPPTQPTNVVSPQQVPPSPTRSPSFVWLWVSLGVLAFIFIIAMLYGLYYLGTHDQASIQPLAANSHISSGSPQQTTVSSNSPTNVQTAATKPSRTVDQTGGLKLASKSAYSCSAEAPADWSITSNQESNSADLTAPNKTMYAGFGIQAVNTAVAPYAQYYQAPLNDPDLYSTDPATVAKGYGKAVLASLGGSTNLAFTNDTNQTVGDYTLRSVASSSHKGVLYFRTQGIPGDGVNYAYAEPMYIAFTTNNLWDSEGLLVAHVAASIKCNVNLVKHYNPFDAIDHSSSSTANQDQNGSDAGYNPQLGTEEVHDPTTGENYVVDPSTNWSNTGPNGPGYYIPKSGGNDYIQLEPGRAN